MGATNSQTILKPERMVLSGLNPYAGTFGRDQLIHLLKRTMFGAKKSDIDTLQGKTLSQVIDILLTAPATDAAPPINTYATVAYPDTVVPLGQTWVYAPEDGNLNGARRNSLKSWWIGNMLNQSTSIHEKMVMFWHNHFSTRVTDTSALLFYPHLTLLRKNALGNFKTFVHDVTLDPNMLRFLNGYRNVKAAPDENYGRELQELFTMGKEPQNYTEADVKATAKLLTGWKIRAETFKINPNDANEALKNRYASYFNLPDHDITNKQFSAGYNNTIIKGDATVNAGSIELDALTNMIFATDDAAKYICRKLYRFFVYYKVDATVEANVIAPLSVIFKQNNFDIKPVLKALLSSEHFFDVANTGCIIKSPVDYLVGLLREFSVTFPDATDYVTQYSAWQTIWANANGLLQQRQDVGDPPNVAGWEAYYQSPLYHEFWVNTDSFPKRLRFTDQLLTTAGFGLGSGKKFAINAVTFTDALGIDAEDPNLLVDRVLELLYRVPVSPNFKAYMKTTILLDGQASDHYWTDAWAAYKAAPTNAMALSIVNTHLIKLYKFLLDSPEYQLS